MMKFITFLLVSLSLPAAYAREPIGPAAPPPTPTPVVTLSPPPSRPLLPSPGQPWFAITIRDEGDAYQVFATVENAAPKDVQVSIEGRAVKLRVPSKKSNQKESVKFVPLPNAAQSKVTKVKQHDHMLVLTIPKKARNQDPVPGSSLE